MIVVIMIAIVVMIIMVVVLGLLVVPAMVVIIMVIMVATAIPVIHRHHTLRERERPYGQHRQNEESCFIKAEFHHPYIESAPGPQSEFPQATPLNPA